MRLKCHVLIKSSPLITRTGCWCDITPHSNIFNINFIFLSGRGYSIWRLCFKHTNHMTVMLLAYPAYDGYASSIPIIWWLCFKHTQHMMVMLQASMLLLSMFIMWLKWLSIIVIWRSCWKHSCHDACASTMVVIWCMCFNHGCHMMHMLQVWLSYDARASTMVDIWCTCFKHGCHMMLTIQALLSYDRWASSLDKLKKRLLY